MPEGSGLRRVRQQCAYVKPWEAHHLPREAFRRQSVVVQPASRLSDYGAALQLSQCSGFSASTSKNTFRSSRRTLCAVELFEHSRDAELELPAHDDNRFLAHRLLVAQQKARELHHARRHRKCSPVLRARRRGYSSCRGTGDPAIALVSSCRSSALTFPRVV